MNRKLIILSLLAGTILAGSLSAIAHDNTLQSPAQTPVEKPFAASIQNSDFAFQGVVTKVEYASSSNQRPIPHTFVTFKVEKALKGSSQPDFVTLRFVGGTDGKGNFLTVSGVPLFDIGDRDIIFAKGNGEASCPLVKCGSGRLRVIENKVFTDDGKPLAINSKGVLFEGKPISLPEVLTNKIGDVTIKDIFVSEGGTEVGNPNKLDGSPSAVKETNIPNSLAAVQTLQLGQVQSLIQSRIVELSQTRQLIVPPNVAFKVDSKAAFSVPEPKPVAPARIALPQSNPSLSIPKNESEKRELEQLRKNGGNPVFTNSKPRL